MDLLRTLPRHMLRAALFFGLPAGGVACLVGVWFGHEPLTRLLLTTLPSYMIGMGLIVGPSLWVRAERCGGGAG